MMETYVGIKAGGVGWKTNKTQISDARGMEKELGVKASGAKKLIT